MRAHGLEEARRLSRDHLAAHPDLVDAAPRELAGRDLACWCELPEPGEPDLCHVPELQAAMRASAVRPAANSASR